MHLDETDSHQRNLQKSWKRQGTELPDCLTIPGGFNSFDCHWNSS
jgi:hypothetical protein